MAWVGVGGLPSMSESNALLSVYADLDIHRNVHWIQSNAVQKQPAFWCAFYKHLIAASFLVLHFLWRKKISFSLTNRFFSSPSVEYALGQAFGNTYISYWKQCSTNRQFALRYLFGYVSHLPWILFCEENRDWGHCHIGYLPWNQCCWETVLFPTFHSTVVQSFISQVFLSFSLIFLKPALLQRFEKTAVKPGWLLGPVSGKVSIFRHYPSSSHVLLQPPGGSLSF